MTKVFYDHLLIIEEVIAVFDLHAIKGNERKELLQVIDKTMHHEILDTILTHLPRRHHEEFLLRFHSSPHDMSLMTYLNERAGIDVEKEILKAANSIKKTLIKEIEAAKK